MAATLEMITLDGDLDRKVVEETFYRDKILFDGLMFQSRDDAEEYLTEKCLEVEEACAVRFDLLGKKRWLIAVWRPL